MCGITKLQIEAEEAISILTTLIDQHYGEELRSSAQVCLGDAEDLVAEGAFAFALGRAHKGISYLTPWHSYSDPNRIGAVA
jgi:hypothetical protein